MMKLRRIMFRMKTDPKTGTHTCASLRSRNAHRHCTRGILCGKLQGKCQMLIPGPAFGASLCDRNDSKCTWTCHKRHFVRKFTGKMLHASPTDIVLCEPAQSKCTWTQEAFLCGNLQGKCRTLLPGPAFCASRCNRNDSNCTWTCHKRHFVQKFTGKMPHTLLTDIVLCESAQSKCTWTCHKEAFFA